MTLIEDRPKRLTLADLEETCRSYPEHIRREKNWMTFQLAVSIIVHFFGKEWVENNIIQDAQHTQPAGFFRMDFSTEREKKTLRVLDFAETLFNLQHVTGFDDRIDQMRTGPVEATYAEFDFARFLYIHKIDFEFVVACGVKGEDYDFCIRYADGRPACADAKCRLEETETRPEMLKHTLEKARKSNLPKDKPGIVFVKVPQTWLVEAPVRKKLIDVVEDFLRQTERIVSVVLYASVIEEWKERGMLRNRHQFHEFENPRHRFDQGKSWVLFRDFEVPLEWKGMPPYWKRVFTRG
jgi:hypothetical protein